MSGIVWITRTHGEKTARAVKALGYEPLVAPVLEVHPLDADPEASPYDAVIFTSRNGVEAFARLTGNRDATAWCVGEATGEIARAAGFRDVISADGDAERLFSKIRAEASQATRFLYAAPATPSAAIADWMRAQGFRVRQCPVYETRPVTPALTDADLARISHVLIHSARAGQAIAAHLCAHGKFAFTNFCFICISEKAWQGFADAIGARDKGLIEGVKRRISPLPDEPSMLNLLQGDGN